MNLHYFQAIFLSIGLGLMAQSGHTAAIKATLNKSTAPEKVSLIEKALNQQKQGDNYLQADNNLKVLTAIKVAPTQSFFATQNERFSRFLQAIFPQNNS